MIIFGISLYSLTLLLMHAHGASNTCCCVILAQTSFYVISVKYLKEVMPYFRKASCLSEIGWDFSRTGAFLAKPEQNGLSSPTGKSDTKLVPLALCHLTKPILPSSPESSKFALEDSIGQRVFEIYSPNRQHVCILRCHDVAQMAAWFSAIHSVCCELMIRAIVAANRLLGDILCGTNLKHMGWLYEKVCSFSIREIS